MFTGHSYWIVSYGKRGTEYYLAQYERYSATRTRCGYWNVNFEPPKRHGFSQISGDSDVFTFLNTSFIHFWSAVVATHNDESENIGHWKWFSRDSSLFDLQHLRKKRKWCCKKFFNFNISHDSANLPQNRITLPNVTTWFLNCNEHLIIIFFKFERAVQISIKP